MNLRSYIFFILVSCVSLLFIQSCSPKAVTKASNQNTYTDIYSVGFYNVENLFDNFDNTEIRDDEFTPSGQKVWTSQKLDSKIANIASVIGQLGKDSNPKGLSLIGLSEIENDTVVKMLIEHHSLSDRNYGYIHHNSQDNRGIDVALIYNKDHFTPTHVKPYYVDISFGNPDFSWPTRDVLLVSGKLDGELVHITVNHWPSRSGGESKSARRRNKAAEVNRHIVDSLMTVDPGAKIIIGGDLNDNPNNESLTQYLSAKKSKAELGSRDMYNPMYQKYNNGQGSNAFRDRWDLFDQIVVSPGLLDSDDGLSFAVAKIYKKPYLLETKGQFKGYPYRTFSGDIFQNGYSDHLPVFIHLTK